MILEFTSSLLIDIKQQVFFLHGLHLWLLSIIIQLSPIGPVIDDLFAPKNDIVGTPTMEDMCPRPLSAAMAYLHKDIKIMLCLRLYLPQIEVIFISLLLAMMEAFCLSSLDPKI